MDNTIKSWGSVWSSTPYIAIASSLTNAMVGKAKALQSNTQWAQMETVTYFSPPFWKHRPYLCHLRSQNPESKLERRCCENIHRSIRLASRTWFRRHDGFGASNHNCSRQFNCLFASEWCCFELLGGGDGIHGCFVRSFGLVRTWLLTPLPTNPKIKMRVSKNNVSEMEQICKTSHQLWIEPIPKQRPNYELRFIQVTVWIWHLLFPFLSKSGSTTLP